MFEKKKTYYNNIGSLRAVVYPDFVNNLFIPYNNLLKNGKFVQAEVEEVSETAVKIRGLDKPVTFDYCIITVGSVYNFPGRVPWWIGNFACKKMFIECHAKLCNANRVTIVCIRASSLFLRIDRSNILTHTHIYIYIGRRRTSCS